VEALARLRSRSCIIDGEAVACDESGIAQFNCIRYRSYDGSVFLYAFDLIELNGDDLRRDPFQVRKATLTSTLTKAGAGIRFTEHLECDDDEIVFRHACKLGLALPIGRERRRAGRRTKFQYQHWSPWKGEAMTDLGLAPAPD
jgi:bifunctional non-homologous end joining protein LigD